jgi:hypothetical protein
MARAFDGSMRTDTCCDRWHELHPSRPEPAHHAGIASVKLTRSFFQRELGRLLAFGMIDEA